MQDPDRHTDPSPGAVRRETGSGRIWRDWPRCTECGRRRLTVCPVCGTAGDRFALAEYLAPAAPLEPSRGGAAARPVSNDAGPEILLRCPQCDEAFAPRFYRWCPQCGQDAGTGIDMQASERVAPWPDRTLLVLCALIGLMAAIVGYFRWLFR